MPPTTRYRSKTVATWIAVVGGSLGAHRFYLHGWRDPLAWLHWPPTLLGLAGVLRLRNIGLDDGAGTVLTPLLGLMIALAMLCAIVYGLTPDEKWQARWNSGHSPRASGWTAVFGVIVALLIGAGVLLSTIAFSVQRYFESQVAQNSQRPT